MITLPANSLMDRIHNTKGRMPAFLTTETSKVWLGQNLSYEERKEHALNPVPDEFLDAYPVLKVGDEEEYKKLMEVCCEIKFFSDHSAKKIQSQSSSLTSTGIRFLRSILYSDDSPGKQPHFLRTHSGRAQKNFFISLKVLSKRPSVFGRIH